MRIILKSIWNFLKRILPPPVRTFLREIEGLRQLIEKQTHLLEERQQKTLDAVARMTGEVQAAQAAQTAQTEALRRENEALVKKLEEQTAHLERMEHELDAVARLTEEVQTAQSAQAEVMRKENEALAKKLEEQTERLEQMEQELNAAYKERSEQDKTVQTALRQAVEERKQLAAAVEKTRLKSTEGMRYASEAVWAEVFNNAISGSAWLKNTAFSPGRWAVGYPELYVMYRVLNEARPKRILELGLGQSTRMIAQYAAVHKDVEHTVVENDAEWIEFFKNDFALSECTKIVQLETEMLPYKDADAVRVFKGFREAFAGQKFDFIFIDAPLASDMTQYARIDVLRMLPECLSDDFVVMLDDAERSGETHTTAEMEKCIQENAIPYKKGRYCGKKDTILISAEHMSFLTSM